MKKVLIKSRADGGVNFDEGGKMYGAGGEYTVEDDRAARWERDGRAKITADLGADFKPTASVVKDEVFLQKVRDHADDLIGILEQAARSQHDRRMAAEDQEARDKELKARQEEEAKQRAADEEKRRAEAEEAAAKAREEDANPEFKPTSPNAPGGAETVPGAPPPPPLNEGPTNSPAATTTEIPDDFPYKKELNAGGVTTMEQLRSMDKDKLTAINNIGERKATQIGVRLSETK
jgi:hypothetical protein